MRYETDEYVQPFYSGDCVNVNCVLSWKTAPVGGNRGGKEIVINLHNGWVYRSPDTRDEEYRQILAELHRVSGY